MATRTLTDTATISWDEATANQVKGNVNPAGLAFQPVDSDLTAIAALTTTAYGRGLLTLANATALAAEVDSFFLTPAEGNALYLTPAAGDALFLTPAEGNAAYQPLDADILKADASDTLTVGFNATESDAGTKTTGTFTPDPASGNFQKAVNGGAHTLAPPGSTCSIVLQYTNNGSAGAITTSGFTKVSGDVFTTTSGHDFMCYLVRNNGFSHLNVVALQ